jgi:hypothetical protein
MISCSRPITCSSRQSPITVLLTNTNWWPCSVRVAIALERAGCRVAAAYPKHGHPLAKTKAVTSRFQYRATSPLQSVAEAIRASAADIVVPCDDRALSHLHQLYATAIETDGPLSPMAKLIERSLGASASYAVVSSRSALLQEARDQNIRIPDKCARTCADDLRRWSATQPLPWVIKVDRSWGGLGVRIVHSLQDAEDCIRRMNQPLGMPAMLKRTLINRDSFWFESWRRWVKPGITVQSYIEGYPANCCVFCWKGKVLAGIAVNVIAAQGVTGPATIVRIVDSEQMLGAARTLAASLQLSGFHGFDFMIDSRTREAYLVELNPRCTMPCHLRLSGGRDLIGALCSEISGSDAIQWTNTPDPEVVAYFPQAWLSDPKCEALNAGYHDVPWDEPELVRELLLLPWPDRSILARLSDRLRNSSFEQRSARKYVFSSVDGPAGVEPALPVS